MLSMPNGKAIMTTADIVFLVVTIVFVVVAIGAAVLLWMISKVEL